MSKELHVNNNSPKIKFEAVRVAKAKLTLPTSPICSVIHDEDDEEACRRSKERRIDFVIEKVKMWRRFFNGVPDKLTGNLVRYSLEEAAHKVGLSKKSLDDYLLQIRFEKLFDFDFELHRNDNIGVLR